MIPLAPPAFVRGLMAKLNRAPFWRREMRVWRETVVAPSADRLLYAALHRIGWMGRAERKLFAEVIRPGMRVVDVGANIGLYAQLFAGLVGPEGAVYAFEPEPLLFAALARGRDLAARGHLHVFALALGDEAGKQPLHRSCFNSGDNRLGSSSVAGNSGASDPEISVVRGDEQLAAVRAVDFIKIDVQGWELHALRGLSRTIERSPHLQIYLEFWPAGLRAAGCEPHDLFRFLEGHGLTILRQRGGLWAAAGPCTELEKEVSGHRYINLWARKLL